MVPVRLDVLRLVAVVIAGVGRADPQQTAGPPDGFWAGYGVIGRLASQDQPGWFASKRSMACCLPP
jgi:hypothetical protein